MLTLENSLILEDFGEEIESKKDSDKKANHGLVLMWQSLAENFVQPIAVFASHGPVKGIIQLQTTIIRL